MPLTGKSSRTQGENNLVKKETEGLKREKLRTQLFNLANKKLIRLIMENLEQELIARSGQSLKPGLVHCKGQPTADISMQSICLAFGNSPKR